MGTITPIGSSKARSAIMPPAPLSQEHGLHEFRCGKEPLDDWLRRHAVKQEAKTARTYVVCLGNTVVGYYTFANGAVRIDELPKRLRRNVPLLVPTTLLARLAVDERFQGMGIGKALLKDAFGRAVHASKIVGSRAVMVHAIDDEAAAFYASYGFQQFPEGTRTFFLPMETVAAAVGV